MPTKEPRLNIVLDKETRELIAHIAARRETTMSRVAADLIGEALEDAEDKYWSARADTYDRETTKWVPFEEAWSRRKKRGKK